MCEHGWQEENEEDEENGLEKKCIQVTTNCDASIVTFISIIDE